MKIPAKPAFPSPLSHELLLVDSESASAPAKADASAPQRAAKPKPRPLHDALVLSRMGKAAYGARSAAVHAKIPFSKVPFNKDVTKVKALYFQQKAAGQLAELLDPEFW